MKAPQYLRQFSDKNVNDNHFVAKNHGSENLNCCCETQESIQNETKLPYGQKLLCVLNEIR